MTSFARLIIAASIDTAPIPDDVRTPSADVAHVCVDQFGIDDARSLVRAVVTRPIERSVRSFVVVCGGLTTEAQNALLKLFEEPPSHAQFFLVVPHESRLIPTLRSRFVLVERAPDAALRDDARAFLAAPYADRLATIAALHTKKDAVSMEALARGIIAHTAQHCHGADGLGPAAFVDRYIGVRGGSKKMLLEYLAVTAPRVAS